MGFDVTVIMTPTFHYQLLCRDNFFRTGFAEVFLYFIVEFTTPGSHPVSLTSTLRGRLPPELQQSVEFRRQLF